MAQLIDLTRTLHHQMPVYPGEKQPSILLDKAIAVDGYNSYRLESAMHAGTHLDAPMHVSEDETTIDCFDVSLFSGIACLIDVRGENPVRYREEWSVVFRQHEIVLFFTNHDSLWNTPLYYGAYPDFEALIATKLAEHNVRIAGFDSPSPDRMPYDFHLSFLKGNHFMLENLVNLDKLPINRSFRLYAFPLKIQAEASLLRVVAEVE